MHSPYLGCLQSVEWNAEHGRWKLQPGQAKASYNYVTNNLKRKMPNYIQLVTTEKV